MNLKRLSLKLLGGAGGFFAVTFLIYFFNSNSISRPQIPYNGSHGSVRRVTFSSVPQLSSSEMISKSHPKIEKAWNKNTQDRKS